MHFLPCFFEQLYTNFDTLQHIWLTSIWLKRGKDSSDSPSSCCTISGIVLTIHGKGKKDRTVPLPESILPELKAQMKAVGELHEKDLAAGYDGVFLDDIVETKYPKTPKEYIYGNDH